MQETTLFGTLLVIALTIGAIAVYMTLRGRKCPGCRRAKVPGRDRCPFCGSSYSPSASIKTPLERPPTPPPKDRPRLVCLEGLLKGREIIITSSDFTLGRSRENKLAIEGMLVSRRHAQIVLQDGQWILYDRDSANGTYVNNRRVAQHTLRPGDEIQIGPAIFAFQMPGMVPAPVAVPTAPKVITPRPVSTPPPPAMLERAPDLRDFRLGEIHTAKGGMAKVFKGARYDGTIMAIKVLWQADPYVVAKFQQEGERIGKMLRHPHIVRVYKCGRAVFPEVGDTFYIIMEWIDEGTLRDRLVPGQPFPWEAITPIVGQTCEALEYAHSCGVVHRDIKPENIMFSSTEGVKVVDFGIARDTSTMTRTSEGMIVGTPYYMSFEQAKGQRVDARSDIYSLGVVLYEMLTGQVPFSGDPLTVVHKHITKDPVLPRKLNPAIPPEVEAVTLRAMAKDCRKRFQTAKDMAAALGYKFPVSLPVPPMPEERKVPEVRRPEPRLAPRPLAKPGQLSLVRGKERGKRIDLGAAETTLQRRDIDPSDMLISRRHARVFQRGGQFWLEDLNSTNGTFHNGQRIFKPGLLQAGDEIRVGNSVLRFEG